MKLKANHLCNFFGEKTANFRIFAIATISS